MSKNQAIGSFLSLPEDFIKSCENAEKAFDNLQAKADAVKDKVIKAFKDIGNDGVNSLTSSIKDLTKDVTSLNEIANMMKKLNLNTSNTAESSKSLANNISDVANKMNAINNISGGAALGGMSQNIAELKTEINAISKTLSDTEAQLSKSAQQALVNRRAALQEELKLQETSTNKKVSIEQKANKAVEEESDRSEKAYLQSLNNRIKAAQAYQARMQNIQNAQRNAYYNTTKGAIEFAQNADTMNKQIAAVQRLKTARENLSTTDENYSRKLRTINSLIDQMNNKISSAKSKSEQLRNAQRNLMDISGQLARKLALMFSVSQISSYIKKMVEVHAEFEIQKRSLEAILMNKDKANALWEKTVALAVNSPFTVKQLTSYTKQLAAYRIEAEKLYDTNKMLADVSAGLGVDMQRLILAFGQVKAANYLRGTELRQFSEAGINILGELSKYYEELEHRQVTVADVQERVTKRMVSFGDVEEVFKRITSAGNIFYNMQEIQAETLRGKFSNLTDSIDIMMDEIGSMNHGALVDIVDGIKNITSNWYVLSKTLQTPVFSIIAGGALSAAVGMSSFSKAVFDTIQELPKAQAMAISIDRGIVNISNKFGSGVNSIKAWRIALSGAVTIAKGFISILSGLGVAALLYGLFELIKALRKSSIQADQLRESLVKIQSEGDYQITKLANGFEALAQKILSTKEGTEENNKALTELKNTYSEYLPMQSLTIEGLKEMKGNYNAVTEAIRAKIEMRMKERRVEEVSNIYGKDVDNIYSKLSKDLKNLGVAAEDVKPVLRKLREGIESGDITNLNYYTKLRDILKELTGIRIQGQVTSAYASSLTNVTNLIPSFIDAVTKLQDKIKEVSLIDSSSSSSLNRAIMKGLDKTMDGIKSKVSELDETMKGQPIELINEAKAKKASQLIANYIDGFKKGYYSMKVSVNGYTQEIGSDNQFLMAQLEQLKREQDNLVGSKSQQAIRELVVRFAELNNVDLSKLTNVFLGADEAVNSYSSRMRGNVETLKNSYTILSKTGSIPLANLPFSATNVDDAKKQAQVLIKFYEELANATSGDSKKEEVRAKKAAKTAEEIAKAKIDAIKQTGEAYNKMLKYYDKEEAKIKALKVSYAALREAGLSDTFIKNMGVDEKGVITAVGSLMGNLSGKARKAVETSLIGLKSEAEIKIRVEGQENFKKELDDIFSNYELSVSLKELGLDDNLTSRLFGVDITSLEQLKEKIKSLSNEAKKLGEEGVKTYDEASKKLDDLVTKQTQEQLKKYAQYLKNQYSERVTLEIETQKQINEIRDNERLSDIQKQMVANKLIQEMNEKLAKMEWEEFSKDETFNEMFQNVDYLSTRTLKNLKDGLNSVSITMKDLKPSQIREIYNSLSKINEELYSRNPFANLSKNVKEYLKAKKELSSVEGSVVDSNIQVKTDQAIVDNLSKKIALGKANNSLSKEELVGLEAQLSAAYDILKNDKKENDELKKKLGLLRKVTSETKKQLVELGNAMSKIAQTTDAVFDSLEGIGVRLPQNLKYATQGVNDLGNAMSSAFSGDIAGAISSTVSGIISLGKSAVSIFGGRVSPSDYFTAEKARTDALVESLDLVIDKKKEYIELSTGSQAVQASNEALEATKKEIEAYKDLALAAMRSGRSVASHSYEYRTNERIQGDLERVSNYVGVTITGVQDLLKLSGEQLESIKTNLPAFWSKIDTNIREGLDGIIETEEKAAEIQETLTESLTSTSFDSLSSNFLSTLKEMDADAQDFADDFKEMMLDALLSDLMKNKYNDKLKTWLEHFSKAQEDGMSTSEFNELQNEYKGIYTDALNDAKAIKEMVGYSSTDGLSGLQQGIQGVTEQTAQALEAVLNSIMFSVSNQTSDVSEIKNMLASYFSATGESPMLTELKGQTELIKSINSMMSSVLSPAHTKGGYGIKVFMD